MGKLFENGRRAPEVGAAQGQTPEEEFDPARSAQLLMTPTARRTIGREEVRRAAAVLKKYRDGKRNFEERIIDEEKWWKLRQNEALRRKEEGPKRSVIPNSAWTFNSITNKHADWMDNAPTCQVLPREAGDREDAQVLSEILEVIDERRDYEKVWSDTGWYMLKHGVAAEGTFWDPELENGMGDVTTTMIDMLNLFWEPGVTDIQDSRNLFITKLLPNETLAAQYPQLDGKLGGAGALMPADYLHDDTVDKTDKSVVVDWYYKKRAANGRMLLHYCKFVGEEVLFASENDEQYTERGWYDHGKYPVVLKVLYPDSGTVTGFGIIAVCRDPQRYVDEMGGCVLRHAKMAATPRYWASRSSGVNRKQFLDWDEPIIEVEGQISDERLRAVSVPAIDSEVRYFYQLKIEELKETSSNRDAANGTATGGVTAAAAIAALQEAGNKGSRDFLTGGYRAYRQTNELRIELIRQFYTESREFRITGQRPGEEYGFVRYSNAGITDQLMGYDSAGLPLYRRPAFDLKVKVMKRNPYSKMQQMEYAKEFYSAGMFNPENAQAASIALKMMEFEGKDEVLGEVMQGQTLLNICQQLQQQLAVMQQLMGMQAGGQGTDGARQTGQGGGDGKIDAVAGTGEGEYATAYASRLARGAVPDMSRDNGQETGAQI